MSYLFILLFCGFRYIYAVILPYADPSQCGNTQYFQHSSLECLPCGRNQRKSLDSLSCVCNNGYKLAVNDGGPIIKCQECAENQVTSSDGWNCVNCAKDSVFDTKTKTCSPCEKGKILVNRQENGSFYTNRNQKCISCQGETQPTSYERICQRCDQRVIEITKDLPSGVSCTCPVGTIQKGGTTFKVEEEDGICFSSESSTLVPDLPSMYTIRYSTMFSVESAFFRKYFRAAQALCSQHKNFTSCQLLGNLCVMYMYNEDNYENPLLSTTDACKEYLLIVSSYDGKHVRQLTDWPSTMPWLYYKVALSIEALDKTDIEVKFERRQLMKFILVSYHANGTFAGISQKVDILQMCSIPEHVSSQAFLFTTTYKAECAIKVNDLLEKYDTMFYDLYLLINDKVLYPIPVLIENIQLKGKYINQDTDRSKWRLARRFFLVDHLSSRSSLKEKPSTIRYASSLKMLFRLRDDGMIYPPLLKVKYNVAQVATDNEVNVGFYVDYEMNVETRNIEIALGVLSVLGVVYATICVMSWRKRVGVQLVDCASIMIFILYTLSALSFVFFILVIGTCFQWLFFFKQQTSVIIVLPTIEQEKLLKGLFVTAFIMKAIDIIYMLYTQIFVDIFFIDWERSNHGVESGADETRKNSVSIMRTLFVANEWREVQTTRRINPLLLVLIVLFLLEVVGFQHWTTTHPANRLSVNPAVDYIGEVNFCLRISLIFLLYLIVALILWVLFGFIYERFVNDSIGDFIDFCSMSNISVFVLSHSHFGYYIHGRSVHGRADTNLYQLYEQFQREEENLCGTRGLEPNSDKQFFEVAVTMKFRNDYDKILQMMLNRDAQGARRSQLPARQNPGFHGTLPPVLECSVNAYNNMNRYLSSFIEHAIRDNNYMVKEKYFLEKLLHNELQSPQEISIFYNDDNRSFTSILLYGQEGSLLMFYLMLFLLLDWLSNWNLVLATVITYFVDLLILTIRDSLGKRNLARKTMVDERFLI